MKIYISGAVELSTISRADQARLATRRLVHALRAERDWWHLCNERGERLIRYGQYLAYRDLCELGLGEQARAIWRQAQAQIAEGAR